jgi:hypothetical protein
MSGLVVSGSMKGFGMIEVKDIVDTEDGGAIIHIEVDMEDLKRMAKVGILKILIDTLEEISND